jgi:hypothetical protein
MIVTYYLHSKDIHNLKDVEFEILKKINVFFKSPLPHVNGL